MNIKSSNLVTCLIGGENQHYKFGAQETNNLCNNLLAMIKQNPRLELSNTNSYDVLSCSDFQSCFNLFGEMLGYSKDIYFSWGKNIFTTELKSLHHNDQ